MPQALTDMAATYRETADDYWLSGYLSGVAVDSHRDILKDTDANSLQLWVDNYCQQQPLDNLEDAGHALAVTLLQRLNAR